MATHEILTLQLGGYANYVGAHFWNFQARPLRPSLHPRTPPSDSTPHSMPPATPPHASHARPRVPHRAR